MSPTIEVSLAETATAGVTSDMGNIPAAMISNGVTIVDTSALPGNNRKDSAINFLYIVFSFFNSKVFSKKSQR